MVASLAVLLGLTQRFQKIVIDPRFLAEGVAIADVDRDGKNDVVAGNVWFKNPNWKPTEIAPLKAVDPKTGYSDCFHTWMDDLNGDGWLDQIVIGMPGEKATWRLNPGRAGRPWKEHLVWHSAGNESPWYGDLLNDGRNVLVMATDDQYLAWFEPGPRPSDAWICHPISGLKGAGSQRYSHGLGVGRLTKIEGNVVLATGGYYKQPSDPRIPWSFVPADLGPDCAQMLVTEQGILTTSAHRRGIWRFAYTASGYERHTLDQTISQTHAAASMTLGGRLNLITGKRKWAHPPGVDEGSDEPSWLVRYEHHEGTWTRHLIDDDSGVGTQIAVKDVNGDRKPDIAVSNKNGVFLFLQK